MSDQYTQDPAPAASGTTDAAIHSDLADIFGELATFAADMKNLRDQVAALGASASRPSRKPAARSGGGGAKPSQPPVTDPQKSLLDVARNVTGATHQLADDEIAAYADQVKSAVLALRNGTYPAGVDPTDVKSTIAYQIHVRDALLAALAALFGAARDRDPYAPQLQIA